METKVEETLKVENTHWGESDKKRFQKFVDVIPKIERAYFEDWQHRVDYGNKIEHSPMITVYVVTAMEYTYRTELKGDMKVGISEPTGCEKTYMVTAENYRKAYDAVDAYLKNHYPTKYWAFRTEGSRLILDGTK